MCEPFLTPHSPVAPDPLPLVTPGPLPLVTTPWSPLVDEHLLLVPGDGRDVGLRDGAGARVQATVGDQAAAAAAGAGGAGGARGGARLPAAPSLLRRGVGDDAVLRVGGRRAVGGVGARVTTRLRPLLL